MPVHIGVLDYEVAAFLDEAGVGPELGEHVILRVVRIQDHQGVRVADQFPHLEEDFFGSRGALQIGDAVVAWSVGLLLDVYSDNAAFSQKVTHVCQKQGTATMGGAGLYHETRLRFEEDLLIDPHVQRRSEEHTSELQSR